MKNNRLPTKPDKTAGTSREYTPLPLHQWMRRAFCSAPFIKAFKYCILIRGDLLISPICTSLLSCLVIMRGFVLLWFDADNLCRPRFANNIGRKQEEPELNNLHRCSSRWTMQSRNGARSKPARLPFTQNRNFN